MNVLYAWLLPVALSLVAFLLCLAIPRFGRYSLRALVVPVAFAFCASVGAAVIVISLHKLGLPVPRQTWNLYVLYFVCGAGGAWLASLAGERVGRKFGL
jgi:hypothetical protein